MLLCDAVSFIVMFRHNHKMRDNGNNKLTDGTELLKIMVGEGLDTTLQRNLTGIVRNVNVFRFYGKLKRSIMLTRNANN